MYIIYINIIRIIIINIDNINYQHFYNNISIRIYK